MTTLKQIIEESDKEFDTLSREGLTSFGQIVIKDFLHTRDRKLLEGVREEVRRLIPVERWNSPNDFEKVQADMKDDLIQERLEEVLTLINEALK